MIILDTNVVSELMRDEPSPIVIDWVNAYPQSALFVTTITEAEIRYGIAIIPVGKRRDSLKAASERMFDEMFLDRILPFDRRSAREYSEIAAKRRSIGLSGKGEDVQIAAIAKANGAAVGTRNVAHFLETGIEVINPWDMEISRR